MRGSSFRDLGEEHPPEFLLGRLQIEDHKEIYSSKFRVQYRRAAHLGPDLQIHLKEARQLHTFYTAVSAGDICEGGFPARQNPESIMEMTVSQKLPKGFVADLAVSGEDRASSKEISLPRIDEMGCQCRPQQENHFCIAMIMCYARPADLNSLTQYFRRQIFDPEFAVRIKTARPRCFVHRVKSVSSDRSPRATLDNDQMSALCIKFIEL